MGVIVCIKHVDSGNNKCLSLLINFHSRKFINTMLIECDKKIWKSITNPDGIREKDVYNYSFISLISSFITFSTDGSVSFVSLIFSYP